MERKILHNPKTMKTNLLCKICSIICALMFASFSSAQAATINSTYTGPIGGNWNDPANWSPNTVPNNNGTDTFNVSVDSEYPGVTLDVDVNLNSLTLSTRRRISRRYWRRITASRLLLRVWP